MCMHLNRDEYTTSPTWPIVPFRLARMNKEEQKSLNVVYTIGLDPGIVRGWSMMITEEIGHSALIYDKPLPGGELKKVETERYYSVLSPVCHKLRQCSKKCANLCEKQDKAIVTELFEKLDQAVDGDDSAKQIDNFDICIDTLKKPITVRAVYDESGVLSHFEYQCPTTHMTELAFPVYCEGFVIALVITGQVIENSDQVQRRVENWLEEEKQNILTENKTVPTFNWEDISKNEKNKSEIVSTVRESIRKLEFLYQDQVDGERRRILNGAHNDLIGMQQDQEGTDDLPVNGRTDDAKGMRDRLVSGIQLLTKEMGVEQIYLYWDDDLEAEPNINGTFFEKWKKKNHPGASDWFQHPMDCICGVGDLFEVAEGRIEGSKIPNDDSWSVFVHWPVDESVAPIIMGVRYKDKRRYLHSRNSELYWEKYVLSKYAVFIQSLAASRIAKKRANALDDNRTTMEHEIGQINAAVQFLGERFGKYVNDVQNFMRDQFNKYEFYSLLESKFSDFIHRSELYREDMEGQFHLVSILAKIYDDIDVNPKTFDLYSEFLNKWRFCFNAKCNEKYNKVYVQFYQPGEPIRRMYSDPQMLEYAVYNIVNNAIKYSYFNTKVSVDLNKSDDDRYHVFTVTDYGLRLDRDDQTIYERGVKKASGSEFLQIPKDEVSVEGKTEGKGLGLYWCKRLANALGCELSHDSKEVSTYFVPLLKLFLRRYRDDKGFRDIWNREAAGEEAMSHEAIKREYNRLVFETKEFPQIINEQNEIFEDRIGIYSILDDIMKPTYRVTFTIRVPKYTKGGK